MWGKKQEREREKEGINWNISYIPNILKLLTVKISTLFWFNFRRFYICYLYYLFLAKFFKHNQ